MRWILCAVSELWQEIIGSDFFGRRHCVEGAGFVFGLLGFVFALSALKKIRRLENQLKEAGVLKTV
jgi:hypothetical protein